jgi:beta-1,4-N-acetylglucosaminyltransferase
MSPMTTSSRIALDPDQRAVRPGRFGSRKDSRSDVLLVCSPGGHLQQMLALGPAWDAFRHAWVALRAPDAEYLLADEVVVWGRGPTNRSVSKFLLNLPLAWRTLRRLDPAVVISTGAGLAVPFLLLRTVYVESFTRVEGLSLSGRLLYPLAHRFFVQWPEAARHHRKAIYAGSVL